MVRYIYQHSEWPYFIWDNNTLLKKLSLVKNSQDRLNGYINALGFKEREQTFLDTLTSDVLKSTEIEGEILNLEQVRSSIARRLGIDIAGLIASDRHVDGVVEMMVDATQNYSEHLTKDRLLKWHSGLFPGKKHKIIIGNWRNDSTGPMQVVSGAMGKEKVHYQAPEATLLEEEMMRFLHWFNSEQHVNPAIKAAIAHLWFVTVHPFEDGNGRIARAIADMQLTRGDKAHKRFYSMSAQIRIERNAYYTILEKTQKGTWI